MNRRKWRGYYDYFSLENDLNRVSRVKIKKMANYLRERGMLIYVYDELSTSNWLVKNKNVVYSFTENYQVAEYLQPLVNLQLDKDYKKYMQERAERVKLRCEVERSTRVIPQTKGVTARVGDNRASD